VSRDPLSHEREMIVRLCDVCGKESYAPVWLATRCGGAWLDIHGRTVLCHGHFVDSAASREERP
jgi:hypothetical protein